MEERKRYIFRYKDIVMADWYETEEQMIHHAQGMVTGLRVLRKGQGKNPNVYVFEVQEDNTEKLVRIQS